MALKNPEYQLPLVELAKKLNPTSILEVGFGYGFSAEVWLSSTKAKVTSIDQVDYPLAHIDSDRFLFIVGDSPEVLGQLKDKYDLIYIDGDHRYEGVKLDLEAAVPLLTDSGVILVDDYGVVEGGGVTFSLDGTPGSGVYGVKQATDEVLKGWKRLYKDIKFANGARVYGQP